MLFVLILYEILYQFIYYLILKMISFLFLIFFYYFQLIMMDKLIQHPIVVCNTHFTKRERVKGRKHIKRKSKYRRKLRQLTPTCTYYSIKLQPQHEKSASCISILHHWWICDSHIISHTYVRQNLLRCTEVFFFFFFVGGGANSFIPCTSEFNKSEQSIFFFSNSFIILINSSVLPLKEHN